MTLSHALWVAPLMHCPPAVPRSRFQSCLGQASSPCVYMSGCCRLRIHLHAGCDSFLPHPFYQSLSEEILTPCLAARGHHLRIPLPVKQRTGASYASTSMLGLTAGQGCAAKYCRAPASFSSVTLHNGSGRLSRFSLGPSTQLDACCALASPLRQ